MAFDFTFTEEHEELRATIRAFLEEKSDEQAVREQMATERGWDHDVWKQMAEQLGLGGTVVTLLCDSGLKYLSTDLYSAR